MAALGRPGFGLTAATASQRPFLLVLGWVEAIVGATATIATATPVIIQWAKCHDFKVRPLLLKPGLSNSWQHHLKHMLQIRRRQKAWSRHPDQSQDDGGSCHLRELRVCDEQPVLHRHPRRDAACLHFVDQ